MQFTNTLTNEMRNYDMGIIIEILVCVLALGGILVYVGNKVSKNASSAATELLMEMDEHYSNFIEKQRTLLLLEEENGNSQTSDKTSLQLTNEMLQDFIDEVFIIIKPEVDALVGHINSTQLSDVKMQSQSRFFRNVAHIAEAFYEKRKQSQTTLSEADEEKLYSAVKDAIRADMKERFVNWKLGNL
jgi:hypothetical protein